MASSVLDQLSPQKKAPRKSLLERIPIGMLVAVFFGLLVLGGAGGLYLGTKGQSAQDEVGTKSEQLQTANDQVEAGTELAGSNLDMCQNPEIVTVLKRQGFDDVCELAVVVIKGDPGQTGQRGDRGPGPTAEQIQAAVEEYFRQNPPPEGKPPTVEQVVAAVATYLRANPPDPGRPPTPEEIGVATAAYLAEHAEEFQGKKGEKGDPPSAEDVRAAVVAYCTTDDRCRGRQGPQGPGITGVDVRRDSQGVCTLYQNVENPVTGEVKVLAVQINDEICEPVPPSTPPSVPPTSGGG